MGDKFRFRVQEYFELILYVTLDIIFCHESISNNAIETVFGKLVVCFDLVCLEVVGPILSVSWAVSNKMSHSL